MLYHSLVTGKMPDPTSPPTVPSCPHRSPEKELTVCGLPVLNIHVGFPRQKRLEIWKVPAVCPPLPPTPSLHLALSVSPCQSRRWSPWWTLEGPSPHWPRRCQVSMGRPRIGAAQEPPPPAHAAHNDTQASRYGADSNFPFYLLVQGESESLTGPQTSCQELLIRAEQHKECTRPPAWELAGQSAEMESDRLKEESLLLGGMGRGGDGRGEGARAGSRGVPAPPLQGSTAALNEEENPRPGPLCL